MPVVVELFDLAPGRRLRARQVVHARIDFGAGTFVVGAGGAPPSMITSALPAASGAACTVRPHGVTGVGPSTGMPIVRACQ